MTIILSLIQFPLIYCFFCIYFMRTYGSNFRSVAGFLYLVPLLGWSIAFYSPFARLKKSRLILSVFLYLGLISAMIAFGMLALTPWNEHSIGQASLIGYIGIASLILAYQGMQSLQTAGVISRLNITVAMGFIVLTYGFQLFNQGGWLLGAACIFAYCITGLDGEKTKEPDAGINMGAYCSHRLNYLLVFWTSAESCNAMWDYGVSWEWSIFAFRFICSASISAFLLFGAYRINRLLTWLFTLTLASITIWGFISSEFVLSQTRQITIGIIFGFLFVQMLWICNSIQPQNSFIVRWIFAYIVGMVVSSLLASILQGYPFLRIMYALPAPASLIHSAIKKREKS
jgi:hypothetical protein